MKPFFPLLLLLLALPAAAGGQEISFAEYEPQRWEVGLVIEAVDGPATGVVAAAPIPTLWPEQTVELVSENVSANVSRVSYREVGGGARQMVVTIPRLARGETATAILTFAIGKRMIRAPEETSGLQIPARPPRELREYLGASPMIESGDRAIRNLAEEIAGDSDDAWRAAEKMYDWVRENITYKEGELKGALAALRDRDGDCEEMTSLFVGLCRARGIPARTVWVPGHCYPEFYLEDSAGRGHWYPAQAAGERAFGSMPESRPILQKGDNFRLPELREPQRYAQLVLKSSGRPGTVQPQVRHVLRPAE